MAADASRGERDAIASGVDEHRASGTSRRSTRWSPAGPRDGALADSRRGVRRAAAHADALAILREASPRSLRRASRRRASSLSSRIVAARAAGGRHAARPGSTPATAIVTDDQHTCAAPLTDETAAAVARAVAPHVAAGRDAGARRLRRRHARRRHDDARPRRIGLLGRDHRRRARRRTRSRSGPTSTACSPPIRASSAIRASCRTCRSPKRPSSRISAPRCCTRARSCRPSSTQHSRPHPQQPPARRRRGTLITAEPPPATAPLTALACKRGITVVDITSTRMLMAHGFLRRLFEVFERYRTPVDVVTTSEVSVSVTIDDDAGSPTSSRRSRSSPRSASRRHGDRLRRRRRPARRSGVRDPRCSPRSTACRCGWCRRRPRGGTSPSSSRRRLPAALTRLHERGSAAPVRVAARRSR